jgi:hypothetical protein
MLCLSRATLAITAISRAYKGMHCKMEMQLHFFIEEIYALKPMKDNYWCH